MFAKVMASEGPTAPPWGLLEKLEIPVSESVLSAVLPKIEWRGT